MKTRNEGLKDTTEADWGRSAPAAVGAAAGHTRIWLVDDNRNYRELMAALLAGEGEFDCSRQFPSAEAVLDTLTVEAPPEIILLDNQMGGMSGLDALRPIKRLAPQAHVFMLTACSDGATRSRALRDGASDFFSKSWNALDIVQRIKVARTRPPVVINPDDLTGGGAGMGRSTRSTAVTGSSGHDIGIVMEKRKAKSTAQTRTEPWWRKAFPSVISAAMWLRAVLKPARSTSELASSHI